MARLIDADALKKDWSMGDKCEDCPQDTRRCQYNVDFSRMDICQMIDDAPTIGGWISMNERLPGLMAKCLVCAGKSILVATYTELGWMAGMYFPKPTHWMPLPEPPEEVKQDA